MEKRRQKNIYYPFKNPKQYGLTKTLCKTRFEKEDNIRGFGVKAAKLGRFSFGDSEASFSGLKDFYNKIDGLRSAGTSWRPATFEDSGYSIEYWKRDVLAVLQEILENKSLEKKFVAVPRREYDLEGDRIYTDLHNSNWWWDIQVQLALMPSSDVS